jgi:hypothetical protein
MARAEEFCIKNADGFLHVTRISLLGPAMQTKFEEVIAVKGSRQGGSAVSDEIGVTPPQ